MLSICLFCLSISLPMSTAIVFRLPRMLPTASRFSSISSSRASLVTLQHGWAHLTSPTVADGTSSLNQQFVIIIMCNNRASPLDVGAWGRLGVHLAVRLAVTNGWRLPGHDLRAVGLAVGFAASDAPGSLVSRVVLDGRHPGRKSGEITEKKQWAQNVTE